MLIEPPGDVNKLSRLVIDAAIEVHRSLGPGYVESIYEEALAIELTNRGIPFQRQESIAIYYKGHRLGEGRLDIFVARKIIVELKAVEVILPVHKAQVISYLKATNCSLGILINFNVPLLKDGIKRIVRNRNMDNKE
jgi:GxxExxY protein